MRETKVGKLSHILRTPETVTVRSTNKSFGMQRIPKRCITNVKKLEHTQTQTRIV